MRNAARLVLISAALTAGLALTGASRANAGVSFQGVFPLPNGTISIGIGDPYFSVGAYVPVGYPIYAYPGYGYGFAYHNHWVPVRRYGAAWRVYGQPYFDDVYYHDVHYHGGYHRGYYGGYAGHAYHAAPYRGHGYYGDRHGNDHGNHGHGNGHGNGNHQDHGGHRH